MKKTRFIVLLALALALTTAFLTGCGKVDSVKEIRMSFAPVKTEYVLGEELDLTGAKIEIEMTSGDVSTADVTAEMVSGYDANTVGKQTLTVTYGDAKTTFTVTVTDPATEITLKSPPTKTEYKYGEALDLAGAKLQIVSAGETTETDVTAAMVSGYDAKKLGEQTLTVEYNGVELTFKVAVIDAIKSVALKSAPTVAEYELGDALDLTGAVLAVEMLSGATRDVAVTAAMVSGYDAEKLGEQTVTVEYNGAKLTFKVTVIDKITGVELKSEPTKTEYKYGETLDLAGAVLSVTTVSGATRDVAVTAAMVSGYDAEKLGEQTVTIDYHDFDATFGVIVSDYAVDLTLLSPPDKTSYEYGEALDLTGAAISVETASGEFEDIDVTDDMVSGYDAYAEGAQRVTVSYGDLSVAFVVTVVRDPIYVLPDTAVYTEDLPLLIVGETLEIGLRGAAVVTSGNTDVATVAGNTITAVGFGTAIMTVAEDDDVKTFTLVVKNDYTGKTVTKQSQLSETTQGVNNLYVYRMDDGDIEDDLQAGLQGLELYAEGGGSWWNTISFIGKDHFGGSGTGAIAYRASTAGNYTVDYSAWLLGSIRVNIPANGYLDTHETDGFTTGIAIRTAAGLTVVKSNVGTKTSVIEDATRYQMGTYTADLQKGDELIVFFCSNGYGHSDEVYTDINFVTNSTIKGALLVMPELPTVEDLPLLLIGQDVTLTVRDGATVTSGNTAVAEASGNKITAVGYGSTLITVSESDESESFTLIVKRDYTGLQVTRQAQLSTTTQGVNDLYVYRMDDGDIENDLENRLQGLEPYAENTGWWNGISFVGTDHFGGRGTGAIAFRASTAGNYTVDYSAWMLASLHNGYLNSAVVDGFTTGIAKKSVDGTITVIVSNIGTRNSVIEDATRYQMGTYTADLERGEELIVFFCSNGNGDCDEVFTDINFITNSKVKGELLVMPELPKVEDLPMTTVGQEIALTIRDGATVTSGNAAVATVDGNRISAVGYGTTVITVSESDESVSFTLVVKRSYDGLQVVKQSQLSSTTQGVNNLYVYRMDNGDIEDDLQAGLQGLELYAEGESWWNGISFVGADHFGGRGTGAIAYRASVAGSYTVDYSAWLLGSIRNDSNNGGYGNWNVDGFTMGIAKKAADGTITVVVSNIGDKQSVIADATRYQTGTYTVELAAGEELMVFFCSNGNGDCDEVFTDINFIADSAVGA